MEASDFRRVEGVGEVFEGSELNRGSIFGIGTGGRGVIGIGLLRVIKADEVFLDIDGN